MSSNNNSRPYVAEEGALLASTESLINELGPVQAFSSRIAEKVFVYTCLISGFVVLLGYLYLWFTQVRAGLMPVERLLPIPFGFLLAVIGLIYLRASAVPKYLIWLVVGLLVAAIPLGLVLNGPVSTTFLLVFAVFFHLILKPKEALMTCIIIVVINAGFTYLIFSPNQIEIPQRLIINSILVIGLMQLFTRTFHRLVEGSRKSVGLLNAQAAFLQQALDRASITDPTTKVFNAQGFKNALNEYRLDSRLAKEKACLVAFRVNQIHLEPRQLELASEATFYGLLIDRIKQFLPNQGLIGRVGQNDFVFLVPHSNISVDVVMSRCRHIQKSLNSPLNFLSRKITPDIRMGIVTNIRKELQAQVLIQQATLAMHEALPDFSKTLVLYDENVDQRFLMNQRIATALENALANNQMLVHYQVIIDLKTGKATKAEALLRWVSPELGSVSPQVFIPLAEASNLIGPITQFLLQKIAADQKQWFSQFGISPDISVNISPATLRDSDALLDLLEANYSSEPNNPKSLNLEITEGLQIAGTKQAIDIINELKSRGYQVSFDDFGTGYSSLAYLSKFSVDFLKIDQSFIQSIEEDLAKQAIVAAVVQVAHTLGIGVIAEGIENERQRDLLIKAGCDYGQGFWFSVPLSPDDFANQWIARNSLSPPA